ncbi:hypothetical protein SERLA73DRAFT_184126 [Serpula lacrymans var. lacrymans S7.3]|uniref:Peptidase S9 prolyl oligopeptidase catalytic domain-containing protein n=2 Tax=Serpula lacrymans var. lacrymans TaxID=341189 RepID=F8Q2L1_SERL3|nr:uncharacterized protein SERLADRAFT_356925 [Serpula lacrymans var. lacrymans S7.9]EGN97422.1 hypothetical protein SERLA73DRAFT_184126 [Serpula lacrymans var. lacrymans S7.3]EGO23013.1 hypothetical protein SERLADRAFT_356925 [Serpula lacrymans var. lacrymans S7.9]
MSGRTAPYGTWVSPISTDAVTNGSVTINDIIVDAIRSTVYHIERRPAEKGRSVIVNTRTKEDVFDERWDARSAVHEYGGGAAMAHDGNIYFSHVVDGRVYKIEEGHMPEAVTPDSKKTLRYANFSVCPNHPDLLVCVQEDHTVDTPETVVNTLCVINTTTKTVLPLESGADFYAAPAFSPDGTKLAWQQWNHPDMPWQGTLIYVANVTIESHPSSLNLTDHFSIAGKGPDAESASYVSWINDDTLLFLSDAFGGYRNPWKYSLVFDEAQAVLPASIAEDFGAPYKLLGSSAFSMLDADGKAAMFMAYRNGRSVLYVVDLSGKTQPREVECPFVDISSVHQVSHGESQVVFSGKRSDGGEGIVFCTLTGTSNSPTFEICGPSAEHNSASPASTTIPSNFISPPQPMTLARDDGPLYVVYYAPLHPDYSGSSIAEEKPPCVLNVHGGPTAMEPQSLNWAKQYFTSRGWAWLDVNFSGSSNYGRTYSDRLNGHWGVVDIQDCIDAARILSSKPYSLVDAKRIVIRGGSGGGFAVLAAASTAKDVTVFAAGTSLYGISNLILLGQDTHKFELRYIDGLMGGPVERIRSVYEARSPIYHVDKITIPLLLLQGADDKVVPKEQSEEIVQKINARGGKVEYHLYDGEGHGFRKAETIKAALEAELGWYEEVLGLKN